MKNFKTIGLLLFLFISFSASAAPEMADTFRADGKIYVVVGVVVLLFSVLFAFLFSMDRRLKKLENENTQQ